jgi:hypothetical protein
VKKTVLGDVSGRKIGITVILPILVKRRAVRPKFSSYTVIKEHTEAACHFVNNTLAPDFDLVKGVELYSQRERRDVNVMFTINSEIMS